MNRKLRGVLQVLPVVKEIVELGILIASRIRKRRAKRWNKGKCDNT